jgi:hypothetical protein
MGIVQSFQDTMYLLKNTFVVIGKNPAIFRPTIAQIIWAAAFIAILLADIILWSSIKSGPVSSIVGIILLLSMISIPFSIFFLLILFPFVRMYYRAAQCWMVYHTIAGNNISYKEGLSRAKQNKSDIFILGLWDIFINAIVKRLTSLRAGFIGFLLQILGKVMQETWELAAHYLLPAAIIKEQNVGQALPELKNIKNNVPAALAGSFGVDLAGDALKGYTVKYGIILIIAMGAAGYIRNLPLIYKILPVIIVLLVGIYVFISIFVDMLKTVYFTLFYVSISMPDKIVPEYKEEVTHYLTHQTQQNSIQKS